jgi:hypothetical protein
MDVPMSDCLCQYVREILQRTALNEQDRQAEMDRLEAKGFIIVSGGSDGDDGWDITNARTGQILAAGTGGYEEWLKQCEVLHRIQPMYHIDRVLDENRSWMEPPRLLPGMSKEMAEGLQDWVWDNEEAVRSWLGVST